jgi:hypothetical protein
MLFGHFTAVRANFVQPFRESRKWFGGLQQTLNPSVIWQHAQ